MRGCGALILKFSNTESPSIARKGISFLDESIALGQFSAAIELLTLIAQSSRGSKFCPAVLWELANRNDAGVWAEGHTVVLLQSPGRFGAIADHEKS